MFRSTMFMFSLLLSLAAFAGEYSVYQRINFQEASTWVDARETCIHDDYIYYQKKQPIFVSTCGETECPQTIKTLVQPIVSTRNFCTQPTEDGCAKWTTVDYIQGPLVKVSVFEAPTDLEEGRSPKKVLDYKIQSCDNL